MGQYYDIINFDKHEILTLPETDAEKIWKYYSHKEYDIALMNKLNNNWKGDEIIVFGDYSDYAEKETRTNKVLKYLKNKYGLPDCSQDWTYHFAKSKGGDIENLEIAGKSENIDNLRYVVNNRKKQYIDTAKYPLPDSRLKTPLLLLLTIGNYLEDVENKGENMVGSWAGDSQYITVHSDLSENNTLEEITPDFD